MHHISEEEFRLTNWLTTSKRIEQYLNVMTYNFVNNTCPCYLNEIFELVISQETTLLNLILCAKLTWEKKQL